MWAWKRILTGGTTFGRARSREEPPVARGLTTSVNCLTVDGGVWTDVGVTLA